MNSRAALLLGLLLTSVSSATTTMTAAAKKADGTTAADYERAIDEALDTKNVELILASLGEDALNILAKDAKRVLSITSTVQYRMKMIAELAGKDKQEQVSKLCAWMVALATSARTRAPKDERVHAAMANAADATIRAAIVFRGEQEVEAYRRVARHWRDAVRRGGRKSAEYFRESIYALRDSTVGTTTPALEHYAALYATLLASLKQNSSRDLKIEAGQVAAIYTSRLIEKKKKADARKIVKEALATIESIRDRSSNDYPCASMVYNALLINGYAAGLKKIGEFRCEKKKGRWSRLSFDLPLGWRLAYGSDSNGQDLNTITGYGVRALTRIEFYRYRRHIEYTHSNGSGVGGDNPTGLADRDREGLRGGLGKITRERKRVSGVLNKTVRKSVGYELAGERSGRPRWYRSWYFRGTVKRDTYLVAVSKSNGLVRMDAALEHVLDSIREMPPKKE